MQQPLALLSRVGTNDLLQAIFDISDSRLTLDLPTRSGRTAKEYSLRDYLSLPLSCSFKFQAGSRSRRLIHVVTHDPHPVVMVQPPTSKTQA